MKHEWLYVLIGLLVGTAIGMLITNRFEWISFISLAILVLIYFFLKHLRRKKPAPPKPTSGSGKMRSGQPSTPCSS